MRRRLCLFLALAILTPARDRQSKKQEPAFQTSDRCIACHNGLVTSKGEDVSIGFAWRSSIMANSSHDPYWQASSRREVIDHPESRAKVEDDCSICHMPITRYEAKLRGEKGQIFSHFPFDDDKKEGKQAADGVDCSICHQISKEKLGTRESFNGGFVVDRPDADHVRPEYGPFNLDRGQQHIMQTSTGGYQPNENTDHIRKSELCATCHTLYTDALGPKGEIVGQLPEQMPYLEWLNSDYKSKQTCQDCHMPKVEDPVAITRVFGTPREGMKRHVFVAANFFMERMLNTYRDDLAVTALPEELNAASQRTVAYLQNQAAHLTINNTQVTGGRLVTDVTVENLGGHKLPTAFPSRRAWLHFTVRDKSDRVLFESGAVRPNGSIVGNDNDDDPARFEPHYTEIRDAGQVQIYEDIMGDPNGKVTTGILTGLRFLKDNRLLPHGFDKNAASKDIAVLGAAANDPNFTGAGHRIRYSVALGDGQGPYRVEVELRYQPIGYRWANNLKPYSQAPEPRRFTRYFDALSSASSVVLTTASMIQ